MLIDPYSNPKKDSHLWSAEACFRIAGASSSTPKTSAAAAYGNPKVNISSWLTIETS